MTPVTMQPKKLIRTSLRFKKTLLGTPTTPITPMPTTQVSGGDDDDDPTFPTAKDPVRHPTQNP